MPKKEPNTNGPIFVRKTFGWGWTLNFKRWESYLILALLILFIFILGLIKNGTIKL